MIPARPEQYPVAHLRERVGGLHESRRRRSRIPASWDELIALGSIRRPVRAAASARRLSFDAGRNTTEQRARCEARLRRLAAPRAGRRLPGRATTTTTRSPPKGATIVSVANRAVVAVRARGGSIDGIRADEPSARDRCPFYKRYFLGGATNLRGWGRFDVAPLSDGGCRSAAIRSSIFSTELRVPIWRNLGGVLFLDGGNVWTNPWDFNFNDLRYDIGPGLRYNTPIGPIRVDFGYQLNPIPGSASSTASRSRGASASTSASARRSDTSAMMHESPCRAFAAGRRRSSAR